MSSTVVYQFLFKIDPKQECFYLTGNRYADKEEVLSVYPKAICIYPSLPTAVVVSQPKVKAWQWLYKDENTEMYKVTEFRYSSAEDASIDLVRRGVSRKGHSFSKIEDSMEWIEND